MKHIVLLGIILATSINYIYTRTPQNHIRAYNFTTQALLPDGTVTTIHLSDYAGKKVVLYFYPKDGTPGCTKQAKVFRDNFKKLQEQNIVVIGVSYDSIKSHKSFQKKHELPFILAVDTNKKITKAYGSSGMLFPSRKTILINEKQEIIKRFDSVDITTQIQDILDAFSEKK